MKTTMLDTKPITPGTCEWCGKDCELEDSACSLSCEAQLRRLEGTQGRMVLRSLKLWRKHRGRKDTPGQGSMTEVAALVDRFLKDDRLRREEAGVKRRQQAAADAAKAESAKTAKAKPVAPQTAAPLTDRPDPLEMHE
jgi:hypothetical protein